MFVNWSFQDPLERIVLITGFMLLIEVASDVLRRFLPGAITQWFFICIFFVSFVLLFFTLRLILKREIRKLEQAYNIRKYSSNISQGLKYIPVYIILKSSSILLTIFVKSPTKEQQNLILSISFFAPLVLLPGVLFIRKGFEDTEIKGMWFFVFYAIVSIIVDPFPYLESNSKGDPIKINAVSNTIFFVQQAILCAIAVLIFLNQSHKLANISELGKEKYQKPPKKLKTPVFGVSPQSLPTSIELSKHDTEILNSAKKEILDNIKTLSNVHSRIYISILAVFTLLLMEFYAYRIFEGSVMFAPSISMLYLFLPFSFTMVGMLLMFIEVILELAIVLFSIKEQLSSFQLVVLYIIICSIFIVAFLTYKLIHINVKLGSAFDLLSTVDKSLPIKRVSKEIITALVLSAISPILFRVLFWNNLIWEDFEIIFVLAFLFSTSVSMIGGIFYFSAFREINNMFIYLRQQGRFPKLPKKINEDLMLAMILQLSVLVSNVVGHLAFFKESLSGLRQLASNIRKIRFSL